MSTNSLPIRDPTGVPPKGRGNRCVSGRVQAIDANNFQGPWSEVRVINLVNP